MSPHRSIVSLDHRVKGADKDKQGGAAFCSELGKCVPASGFTLDVTPIKQAGGAVQGAFGRLELLIDGKVRRFPFEVEGKQSLAECG